MHPFSPLFRSIRLSEHGEQHVDLLGPPEDVLPLLADADLNLRVADVLNLQLSQTAEPWVHKWGSLTGLYSLKEHAFNKEWKIPSFPNIHVPADFIFKVSQLWGPLTKHELRRLKLLFPCRFFPRHTKYFPLQKGIKPRYPDYSLHHFLLTALYLHDLWTAGITYRRESYHSISFNGQLYPWEQKLHLSHGSQSEHSKSIGVFPSSQSRPDGPRGYFGGFRSQSPQRSLAPIQPPIPWCLGARLCSSTRRSLGLSQFRNPGGGVRSTNHQSSSQKGEGSNAFNSSCSRYAPSNVAKQLETEVRLSPSAQDNCCTWTYFATTDYCGPYCLKHLVSAVDDWGPCRQDGQHCLRSVRIPPRVTGGIFLVDKNTNNRAECRLVVDFSQFSRGHTRVHWPRFAVPNLQALTNFLSSDLYWLSLDVSAAFYHLPLAPGAAAHLLVGSPGLEGFASGMSFSSWGLSNREHSLQGLHRLCTRDSLATLMLLYRSIGRKLHLLAHPVIMGFRKLPMGVGLSPFLLAQFTSSLASMVRRNFPHCMVFAYMDDVVLGAKSVEHLESVYATLVPTLLSLGIHLNPTKTKRWGKTLHFMGLEISSMGSMPQQKHVQKVRMILRSLPTHKPLDWKILQRLTGLLGYLAPFTAFGYPALMPLYTAIAHKQAFTFVPAYRLFLVNNYTHLYFVRRQHAMSCQVFADATPTGWGLVNYYSGRVEGGTFHSPLPIHVAELIAACVARCRSGARVLGVDNTIVCSHRFTHFPWLLACAANWILRDVSFVYVPSTLNPADAPSRGLLGFRTFPPPLPFRPHYGRVSLYAESPPVSPRQKARVSFASPVRTRADAWRPP
nr:polymerase [Domestic cat hepadnavirus]